MGLSAVLSARISLADVAVFFSTLPECVWEIVRPDVVLNCFSAAKIIS